MSILQLQYLLRRPTQRRPNSRHRGSSNVSLGLANVAVPRGAPRHHVPRPNHHWAVALARTCRHRVSQMPLVPGG